MSEIKTLIPVAAGEIGGEAVQTVNARDLHGFLEVGKDFSTWIKDRIDQYDFVENQDFVCSPVSGSEGRGGHNRKDYHLSIDMAKELSMVERNHKGKEARQYFIECERRAKAAADPMVALNDPVAMRGLLLTYTEKVLALESKVQEQAPKVEVYDRIADAEGSITIRETANTLRVPERKFVLWLQQNNWCYRRAGHKSLLAYADKVKAGYLYLKQTPIRDIHTGEERLSEQVRVTPLGLTVLARRLAKEAEALPMLVATDQSTRMEARA